MKQPVRLTLIFLISLPVWGRSLGEQFADHKPYEQMKTLKDLRQEEDRITQLLINMGAKLTASPLSDALPKATVIPEEPSPTVSEPKQEPRRILRQARKKISERVQQPMDEETYRQFQHFVLKDEVDKLEKEYRKDGGQRSRTNHEQGASSEKASDELKEYVVELPLLSDKPKAERERIKVKMKPSVMKLLKKKQELNKMLVDDVVRMTGRFKSTK